MTMDFDEAIEQMTKASEQFKQAAILLGAAMAEKLQGCSAEPAPPERMIDRHPFQGWYKWTTSRVRNQDDCNVNNYSPLLADLIVNAPATMAAVIDLIDGYDKAIHCDESFDVPRWLREGVEKLRLLVEESGFVEDLQQ